MLLADQNLNHRNFAFYEKYGPSGMKLLENLVNHINKRSIVIADAKRGDIGNTTKKYAISIFDTIGFDSITVSPYMGADSIVPFISNRAKGTFVLCLTSNQSGKDVQKFRDNNDRLYEYISKLCDKLNTNNNIGLVVGATNPENMQQIRQLTSLPWLIPGIGAQGGDLKQSVTISNKKNSIGLINVSRAILFAGDCSIHDVVKATENYNDKINGYF